jgi:Domain of unknown function (DUF4437)
MGRGHVEILNEDERVYTPMPAPGWPSGSELKVLSRDTKTGALTGLLRLAPGFRRQLGSHPIQTELFVIDGTVRIGNNVREWGAYEFSPANTTQEPWVSEPGCTMLYLTRGVPAFTAHRGPAAEQGRISLDTEQMPWAISKVPGPPPGLLSKTLRHDDETGERTFVCCCVPRYELPALEFHDCVEESYCIEGSIRIGTSGLMRAGSYFWRPPYVTHGPFYSREGMVSFFTVDGPLVNHYVDDPASTVEENRAQALADGPPKDFFRGHHVDGPHRS